ncbi:TPA: ClpX C4-type zinc finger protein [Klebsiella quasipneumoniae]
MKNQETGEFVCDFCGKHQDKVAKMFTSHSNGVAICNDCGEEIPERLRELVAGCQSCADCQEEEELRGKHRR